MAASAKLARATRANLEMILAFMFHSTASAMKRSRRLTVELSDHGQRHDRLAFSLNVHRCPWFARVILLAAPFIKMGGNL